MIESLLNEINSCDNFDKEAHNRKTMGPSEKITSQEALVLDGSVIEQDGEDLS